MTWTQKILLLGLLLVAFAVSPVSADAAILSPLDLPGVQLWLDASDASTVTIVGGNVQTWNDKSGLFNNISSASAINRPAYLAGAQNGLNILRFDGLNQSIGTGTLGISNTFDVFLVAWPEKTITVNPQATSGAAGVSGQAYVWGPEFVSSATGRGAGLSLGTNGLSAYQHTDGTLTPPASSSTATSNFNIYSVRYDAGTPSIDINGSTVITGLNSGANIFPSLQFGDMGSGGAATGFGPFKGGLAEVVIFDRKLTTPEYSDVTAYLNAKWSPASPPILPPGTKLYLSSDIMGPGTFATGNFGAQDGYTNSGTVELVGKIANSSKAATPVARPGSGGPTIDFSAHVVGDGTAGEWGSDVHGRGGNIWLPGDGETNIAHVGFGAHANKFVTFDLQDIRAEHFNGWTQELLLEGNVGVNGNASIAGIIQGGIWIDGVLVDISPLQGLNDPSHSFSILIPNTAHFLTLAMLNGDGSTTFDDVAFRDVSLTAVPEPASFVLAACGMVAIVGLRRRNGFLY